MSDLTVGRIAQLTHTPGPWTATQYRESCAWRICDQRGEDVVASLYTARDQGEDNANARLIAAAPDLLAALKDITERFHRCLMSSGTDEEFADAACAKATAAIARAEGRA